MRHSYDVVIATRNRPQALTLSVPLLLQQDPQPQQIIVVDSSDNPDEISAVIASVRARCHNPTPLRLITSPPGLPRQRNIGLKEVSAPVVFFPDDDLLVAPGALQAMLRIYDRDIDGTIGGVWMRGGPGCLNRFSASISGASAGVRLPSGGAAG